MTARPAPEEPLLSAREAAAYLGVSRTFLTDHAVQLRGRKVGSLLKFRRSDLDEYLEAQRVTGPAPVEQPKAPQTNVVRPDWLVRAIASGETNAVTGRKYGAPTPAQLGGRGR